MFKQTNKFLRSNPSCFHFIKRNGFWRIPQIPTQFIYSKYYSTAPDNLKNPSTFKDTKKLAQKILEHNKKQYNDALSIYDSAKSPTEEEKGELQNITIEKILETSSHDSLKVQLAHDAYVRDLWSKSIQYRGMTEPIRFKEIYDFIIVGAGSAGCVLAKELIENIPNINILLLEAGPPDSQINDRISLPFKHSSLWRTDEIDWSYFTQRQVMPSSTDPTKDAVNRSFIYPRGKVWGGCSSINAMVYVRGQPGDYNYWASQGGPEYKIWDYEHCLEAFKSIESISRENPDEETKKYRGFNGLINVFEHEDNVFDIMKDLKKAAVNFGIPENKDYNGVRQNGVASYQASIKSKMRCSVVDGYLTKALEKIDIVKDEEIVKEYLGLSYDVCKISAVNLKSNAHVLNIIWDEDSNGNIARGIKYFSNGALHEAYIAPKGEIILSAGAINSPHLLMLSGIGPRNNLSMNNIKVREDLPVGQNLYDHPLTILSVKVDKPNSTLKSCMNYWTNGPEVAIFHKANEEGKIPTKEELYNEHPDIQITCAPLIFDSDLTNPTKAKVPFLGEGITLSPVLNCPSSVGHLELASQNPFEQPKIFLNYFDKAEDMYRLISSLKLCIEIAKHPPLSTNWGTKDIAITDEFGQWASDGVNMTDNDWEKLIRKKHFTSFHPCGTVKMSLKEKGGVVDHRLRVYGTENLRVVDASIFPRIPSGNTFAPVCMTAWRASKLIEEDYKRKYYHHQRMIRYSQFLDFKNIYPD
ncbi:hypothetical protein Glove_166g25 [Diversispora epigaea]|uniref:Glucose-methanol-choline oxidoreductase N-terminal domain-containing protein n=1 Tax=Diversispora epigaea TaxID=1348612 RepID=A0A397J085_9GLOM|nr:hypothetical protein Glove_166g25 [Diversispora epigaea]